MSSRLEHLAAREVFLNPGQLACGKADAVFGTLLGSCVAITLWHPARRIGCICHYLLPAPPLRGPADGRYGSSAFAQMAATLAQQGVDLRDCVAKVFGGSTLLQGTALLDIGRENIATARQLLQQAGLVPTVEHVGGVHSRRLLFDLASGDVWLRFDDSNPAGPAP